VETWAKLADNCYNLGHKGRGVRVVGRLKQERWSGSDGKSHSRVTIVAEHVEFRPDFKKGESAAGTPAAAENSAAENTVATETAAAFDAASMVDEAGMTRASTTGTILEGGAAFVPDREPEYAGVSAREFEAVSF